MSTLVAERNSTMVTTKDGTQIYYGTGERVRS